MGRATPSNGMFGRTAWFCLVFTLGGAVMFFQSGILNAGISCQNATIRGTVGPPGDTFPMPESVSAAAMNINLDAAFGRRHVLVLGMHFRKAGGSEVKALLWDQAMKTSKTADTPVSKLLVHPVQGHQVVYKTERPIGCTFPDIDALVESNEIHDLDVLFGFFPWETQRSIPSDINVLTTAVIRDPTERAISAYLYEQRVSKIGTKAVFESYKRGLTLLDYANREAGKESSYYMRMFCRCDCTEPYTREDIELAKSRIKQVGVLGLTHRMADYVTALNERVWWMEADASSYEVCSTNCGDINGKSGKKPTYRELYPEAAEIMDAGFEIDWELYRYAEELVESRQRLKEGIDYWRYQSP